MANIMNEVVELGKSIPNLTSKMYDTFVKYKKNMTLNLGAKLFTNSTTTMKREEKSDSSKTSTQSEAKINPSIK